MSQFKLHRVDHTVGRMITWRREPVNPEVGYSPVPPLISLSNWENNLKPISWSSMGHSTIEETELFALYLLECVAEAKKIYGKQETT